MPSFDFPRPASTPEAENLRAEVRAFLRRELGADRKGGELGGWSRFDPAFSRKIGARGWIGMCWPRRYGGGERSALERYVVIEEMLAASAPVGAHWIADRQVGPLLLSHGTEAQRERVLPRIVAGECYVSIGLSEPGVGSDLASVRTRATPVDGGYRLNGVKLWTTRAHSSHYIVVLCRTDGEPGDRHAGLSQLLVDFTWPGVTVRPIVDMTGSHSFNEVRFEDVFVSDDMLIGVRGNGWAQVSGEMGNERSGPDRFLSSFAVVEQLVKSVREAPTDERRRAIGRMASHVAILRRLSMSVAEIIRQGGDPTVQGALVKDVGTVLEQEIPETAREIFALEPSPQSQDALAALVGATLLEAPSFSLRGGTREILRGIIARGLGVR
jgi:alkylation response protein AidB-like acyl-CoA dehydrogenase